jgi:hypothetical protein
MKTRKGLSSVVGMVFAIVAIVGSIGYVTFSMNLLDQYNQSVLARNQVSIDKGNENFQIYSIKITNNKFNVTIANTGNLPINITRMWVQNTTATDWTNFYSINKMVNPGSLLINIGQGSPVSYNSNNAYNLKLVTSRGNSLQFTLGSPGIKPIFLQLVVPSSIRSNDNATILLYVTNNVTSNNLLTNIQPRIYCPPIGSAQNTSWTGVIPNTYPYLASGSTAVFKETIRLTNTTNTDSHITCQGSLIGGSGLVSDTIWFTNKR